MSNCVNWLSLVVALNSGVLEERIDQILKKPFSPSKQIDCSNQDNVCTVFNAMNGTELAESKKGEMHHGILYIQTW